MIIGVARETKTHEYRVGLTPQGVAQLVRDGHRVLVETAAGKGSGFDDGAYRAAGGDIAGTQAVFADAELLVKVKEPLPSEFHLLHEGQTLFTYLHLAPNPQLVQFLLDRKVTAFAYETLEKAGTFPLLIPMSEIAGRMAPLVGSQFLQRPFGGSGVLPCGVPGIRPARAVIVGAGIVGRNAARTAAGLGLETVVLNRSADRLREIDREFRDAVRTRLLDEWSLLEEAGSADMVIGALYAPGGKTPVVIGRDLLSRMKPGAVIVDVTIDQGGCAETSRPTTHDQPVFSVDGILHYCVANMPGAYPSTSTQALANATLPYIRKLAREGADEAVRTSPELASALNTRHGMIVHPRVAAALQTGSTPTSEKFP